MHAQVPEQFKKAVHIILQREGVQVKTIALGPGEEIAKHRHKATRDTFYGMAGTATVETRLAANGKLDIRPGDVFTVEAGELHRVINKQTSNCELLLIQGIGTVSFDSL